MTNFFMVPNEVFDLNLKPHEFSVLCYILKCCDKTKTCYPSIMTIANACSISENTARKCVNNLCERNIISKSGGFAVGKFGKIQRTEEYKCMCKEFKEQIADPDFEGFCHCMLYYKSKD